jgi:hypothetical protein
VLISKQVTSVRKCTPISNNRCVSTNNRNVKNIGGFFMGFFDLKVVCGVCENAVGLNRFKVKKSDAWVCPDCFKKAGGCFIFSQPKANSEYL